MIALAPPFERDALGTDQELSVHDPGVLVVGTEMTVGIRIVIRWRDGFPFEVEPDREPLADLAAVRVHRLVESHTKRLHPEPPVLHRRLAHELGPQ